jgi:lipid-A-disaccharide synthase-like uncharacterized protein
MSVLTILSLLHILIVFSFSVQQDENVLTYETTFYSLKKNATTYYWLAITDKGDLKTYERSLYYLEKAEAELESIRDETSEEYYNEHIKTITLLKDDLIQQIAVASNNFVARYPLVRFLGEPAFLKSNSFGTYELFMPPNEIASANAVKTIGSIIEKGLWGDAQLPMFVYSKKNELPDMESALRATFKSWYRIKIHDQGTLLQIISPQEKHNFSTEHITSTELQALFAGLESGLFSFTEIELYNQTNGINFYKFRTKIYQKGLSEPIQTILHYELIRDKRTTALWIALLSVILIGFSYIVYLIFYRKLKTKGTAYLPFLFWLTGVLTSFIILSVAGQARPDYQEYISYSFWWIPLVFLLFSIACLVIVKKMVSLIPALKTPFQTDYKHFPFYFSFTMGIMNVIGIGLILYHGFASVPYIIAGVYFWGLISIVISKFTDNSQSDPTVLLITIVLFIPVTAFILSGYSTINVLFLILGLSVYHVMYIKSVSQASVTNTIEKAIFKTDLLQIPHDLDEFRLRIQEPPFFETDTHQNIFHEISASIFKKTKIHCITGLEGSGKTATAEKIIRDICDQHENKQIAIIRGYAEEKDQSANPFSAIRIALQGYFNIDPFDSVESKTDKIDKVLNSVLDKVVPFSSLLLPKQNNQGITSSENELFYIITSTISDIAQSQPVIFYLDDIHWLDDSSMRLIQYMHSKISDDEISNILFLYTSRNKIELSDVSNTNQCLEINTFSNEQYQLFLKHTFALDNQSTELILDWLGGQGIKKGNLFWLLQILKLLVNNHSIVRNDSSFSLTHDILVSKKLPIPDDYQSSIRIELNQLYEHKHIIGLAALLGLEFNVAFIAKALNLEYLFCIEALHEIEQKSDIIYDVVDKDGYFSFHSSFTLESIRKEYGIVESYDPNYKLKQIIKEYNAILANTCETELESLSPVILASYLYFAGPLYAEKAILKSIKACQYCIDTFQFNQARNFIQIVNERLEYCNISEDTEVEIALLKIQITIREGKNVEITDDECQRILAKPTELSVAVLKLFAGYYYHTRLYDKGLNISSKILQIATDEYGKAIGLFWRGLCSDINNNEDNLITLKDAYKTLLTYKKQNNDTQNLESQIYNAIGEIYTRMAINNTKYKQNSIDFFNKSIEIKSKPETLDRAGLAKSYGGLGRLELYVNPIDPLKAIEYFEEDLYLSRITGDYKGQVLMHSFIGACYLKLSDLSKAKSCYEKSREMSTNQIDLFFALLGLLEVHTLGENSNEQQIIIGNITELLNTHSLPGFCKNELGKLLERFPDSVELGKLRENS